MFIALENKQHCDVYFDLEETRMVGIPLEERLYESNLPIGRLLPLEDTYIMYFGITRLQNFLKYHTFDLDELTLSSIQLKLVPELRSLFKSYDGLDEEGDFKRHFFVFHKNKMFSIDRFGTAIRHHDYFVSGYPKVLLEQTLKETPDKSPDERALLTFRRVDAFYPKITHPIIKISGASFSFHILSNLN